MLFRSGNWKHFQTHSISTDTIRFIVIDKDNIWCGANNAVVKWNKNSGTFTTISDPFLGYTINSIAIDSDGCKWFSCSQGVCSYNDSLLTKYPILQSDAVQKLMKDNNITGLDLVGSVVPTKNGLLLLCQGIYYENNSTRYAIFILELSKSSLRTIYFT